MVFLVLFFPAIAIANPIVVFDPFNPIKTIMILISTLGPEVFIVTVILYFCHMAVVPVLITLFLGNIVIYFIIFRPILSLTEHVFIAELIIIGIESVFIKLISTFDTFQLEEFKGLKWPTVFIVSTAGNAVSYFLGSVISG